MMKNNSKNITTKKSNQELITTNQVDTILEQLANGKTLTEILEDPNAILWIREKTKFITFLANKLTDLYSDNKVQNVKTNQSIKISWEDNQDDLIDVTAEDIPTATPDKD